MISIAIPIYNVDITPLITSLYEQAVALDVPFQFVLIDDASKEEIQSKNRILASWQYVNYIQLEKNIGRSRIRNLFIHHTIYPYILFMDCDMQVIRHDFLQKYLSECKKNIVCVGGVHYETPCNNPAHLLHWRVGTSREMIDVQLRKKQPNRYFFTSNFLIDKELFQQVQFNEQLQGYGYEDLWYGKELMEREIPIVHIDNPLAHLGLEEAGVFLKKIREGMHNLLRINDILQREKSLTTLNIKILQLYRKIKQWKLQKPIAMVFSVIKKHVENNLTSNRPKMWCFDLYRIGYLCSITQN